MYFTAGLIKSVKNYFKFSKCCPNIVKHSIHHRGIGGYRYVCSLYVWQKIIWTSLNLVLTKENGGFYLRILWNWEVCWCAVLRNSESQVGCLGVQCNLFVGEMTNTLRAISPDPKTPLILPGPRFMIGCQICTCCTWVCLVSKERWAASLCLPRSRTRKNSTSS